MAARKLNLGASTLRRQLSSERRSFRQILEEVRLGTALLLLQTSSRQISEIAASSGYASASRFAVRFRSRFGLSPRDLRAAVLKEAQANDSSAPVVASPDPVAAH
jgi:AraC-like DNA-binding protein